MDLQSKGRRARALLDKGRYDSAVQTFRELCAETHTIEPHYDTWLRGLAEGLARLGRRLEAAYVHLYLQQFDDALALFGAGDEAHRARALEQQGRHRDAAQLQESLGRLVSAAIAFERSGEAERQRDADAAQQDYDAARRCWSRLREDARLRAHFYEEALVHFNLGACCLKLGDEEAGNDYLVMAQRLLEEAADAFETQGQRERAFDCYQILLEMGRRSDAFENLAEGFINCVRILKEDNLKYYALQYYEDFMREAMNRREYQAAASLYREAAQYCRRTGLIWDRHYLKAAAETWFAAAAKTLEDGGAVEMAENALLAAVECFNAVGDYRSVGDAYRRLSELALPTRKQQRYAQIAGRYAGTSAEAIETQPFPEYLRTPQPYPEIWYMDLEEWEQDGAAVAVCAAVVGNRHYPEVVRRRALNVLLLLLEGVANTPEGLARIAEGLGDLQIYTVLSPLERMFENPDVRVQQGVMRALRFLFFKRTFNVLIKGIRSEAPQVRQAAVEALGRLHFTHAFDPLVRIFREMEDPAVRRTALESIGRIPTLEAGDFLVEVLRHETGELRATAKRLLAAFDNRELFPILRQLYELEAEPVRSEIADILRRVEG